MLIVPLQPLPSQVVNVDLAGQNTRLAVYQRSTGLYCDVYRADSLVVAGVTCENMNRIVRDAYLGFTGDLLFIDMQGDADPDYTALGSRFVLAYLEQADLTAVS